MRPFIPKQIFFLRLLRNANICTIYRGLLFSLGYQSLPVYHANPNHPRNNFGTILGITPLAQYSHVLFMRKSRAVSMPGYKGWNASD